MHYVKHPVESNSKCPTRSVRIFRPITTRIFLLEHTSSELPSGCSHPMHFLSITCSFSFIPSLHSFIRLQKHFASFPSHLALQSQHKHYPKRHSFLHSFAFGSEACESPHNYCLPPNGPRPHRTQRPKLNSKIQKHTQITSPEREQERCRLPTKEVLPRDATGLLVRMSSLSRISHPPISATSISYKQS